MEEDTENLDYIKNWIPLGDIYLRKVEIYKTKFDHVDFSEAKMVACPYGGALAFYVPKEMPPYIYLYSPSSYLYSTIIFNDGFLLSLGWSYDEQLVAISNDGIVSEYSIYGKKISSFQLKEKSKFFQAKFLQHKGDTIIFALSTNSKIYIKKLKTDSFLKVINVNHPNSSISCWECYPDSFSQNFKISICLNNEKEKLAIFENKEPIYKKVPITFSYSYFSNICFTFDYSRVALQSDTNNIWLGSSDFMTTYMEILFENIYIPNSMAWFGNNSLIFSTADSIVINGPDNDSLCFSEDGPVFLITENDGVRIVSQELHKFVQLIPDNLVSIYLSQSNSGYILLDAYYQFRRRNYESIELIQKLEQDLRGAIYSCIEASACELNFELQRRLLMTASFGRSFISIPDRDIFYSTCRELRTVNSFQEATVGMPITTYQFRAQPITFFINRLINRRLYTLAYEISKLFNLKEEMSTILSHWAHDKILSSTKPDSELAEELIDKLSVHKISSYSSVIDAALELGRTKLAIKLIQVNCTPELQIAVLLKAKDTKQAIEKALQSNDSNLIYTVIMHLSEIFKDFEFLNHISLQTGLRGLATNYLKEFFEHQLFSFYQQNDDIKAMVGYNLQLHYCGTYEDKKKSLAEVEKMVGHSGIIYSTVTNYSKLMEFQQSLCEKFHNLPSSVGFSIIDTIFHLCENKMLSSAIKIKKDFNVSELRFAWAAACSSARSQLWDQFDDLIKETPKNTFMLTEIIDIMIDNNSPKKFLEKYINKLPIDLRIENLIKAEIFDKAASLVIQSKKDNHIEMVRKALKPGLHDDIIEKLSKY